MSEVKVPTLVSEEATTVDLRVVFVRVLASAVTVMFAVPSKLVPLIVRAVASAVAVEALPVRLAVICPEARVPAIVVLPLLRTMRLSALSAVLRTAKLVAPGTTFEAAAVRVIAPEVVSEVKVPTLVSEEAVTPELRVAPVRVPAAAVRVMFAVPSKLVPLIVRAVWSAVAVPAFPVRLPVIVEEKVLVPAMVWLPVV